MDISSLIVILVSGVIGAAALWIGAGWLRQAARARRHEALRAAPPAVPREDPAARPPRAAQAPKSPPPLLEHALTQAPPVVDTTWPTTNFPATQPMLHSELPAVESEPEPDRGYAETLPMPLEPVTRF